MSDTPRTDSQLGSLANAPDDTCCWLEIGLPRTLERELNRWKALAILLGEYVEPEKWEGVQAYDALNELEHLQETNQPNQ